MKKHTEKTVAAVLTLAGILLASSPSFGADLRVSVGYADNVHTNPGVIPNPWRGSPNVDFVGSAGPQYDAGAIKIDNLTRNPRKINHVSVTIGPGKPINPWGVIARVIPAGGSLILTGFTLADFDTSELPAPGCVDNGLVPVVRVIIFGGGLISLKDSTRVLNTGGIDPPLCTPGPGPTEGHAWVPLN